MGTYWDHTGTYQAQYLSLSKEIPAEGACPADRPALERLRLAANIYYDTFNNGLGNRGSGCMGLLGITAQSVRRMVAAEQWDRIHAAFEPAIDRLVVEALAERRAVMVGRTPSAGAGQMELMARAVTHVTSQPYWWNFTVAEGVAVMMDKIGPDAAKASKLNVCFVELVAERALRVLQ